MIRALAVTAAVACGLATAMPAAAKRPALCATRAGDTAAPPYVAIFSAFPAELVPLLAATQVDDTVEIDGKQFFIGRLGGVNVVLSLLGVGMINAHDSTERLLDNFDVAGIVLSGVAGSQHNIGDVVVARTWVEEGSRHVWKVNEAMRALAKRGSVTAGAVRTCATVSPTDPTGSLSACSTPRHSCSRKARAAIRSAATRWPVSRWRGAGLRDSGSAGGGREDAIGRPRDEETAAVCHVAVEGACRSRFACGVSDGAGDPAGPASSRRNFRLPPAGRVHAAVVTRGIVAELGVFAADPGAEQICQRLAQSKWRSAAKLIRSAP
jgi:hypothetical protein